MAEVKWIKIVTDIFDDEKMLLIDALPDHDTIIVIWFKLLCLAGKQNNGGVFMMNDKIAYTDEMLATIFRRPLNTVRLALNVFCKYQMIEIVDDTITIPNWERHQSLDSYEKKKERDRQYQARLRERQKGLLSEKSSDNRLTSDDKSSLIVSVEQEEERELEEKELEGEIAATQRGAVCPFKTIVELYHSLAPSFPKIRSVDGNRRKAVSARWRQWHDLEVFRTIFTKAEASSFLKGGGKNNWHADFDWMMKPTNFQKILEGKYDGDDREYQQKPTGSVFDTLRQMHEEADQ